MSTIIDNNVPLPDDEKTTLIAKPKKNRARKAISEPATANPAKGLIEALKFVSVAQKKAGTISQQHCYISGNWVAASNEVLTLATRIEEDIQACPHTFSFIEALSKVSQDDLRIIQLTPESLAVSSGDFKGLIQCADPASIVISAPDACIASINDSIKFALEAAGLPVTDGAPDAIKGAVLLQANSAVGTNGHMLIEAWHGIDLPPHLLIPKASAVAISKCGKELTGFGFSHSSVTFWCKDGSFIKTQLFNENYPDFKRLIDVDTNPWNLPDNFYKGVHSIKNLSEAGNVFFRNGVLLSDEYEANASSYKIEGLPEEMGFNLKYLLMLEPYMQKVDFKKSESGDKVFFFSSVGVRGILMGVRMTNEEKEQFNAKHGPRPTSRPNFSDIDDDIPF